MKLKEGVLGTIRVTPDGTKSSDVLHVSAPYLIVDDSSDVVAVAQTLETALGVMKTLNDATRSPHYVFAVKRRRGRTFYELKGK